MSSTPSCSLEFCGGAVRLLGTSGRPVPQLARELGCSSQSLGDWARRLDVEEGKAEGLSFDEREELRCLRREVGTLSDEREILRRPGILREGQRDPAVIFRFVRGQHRLAEPLHDEGNDHDASQQRSSEQKLSAPPCVQP